MKNMEKIIFNIGDSIVTHTKMEYVVHEIVGYNDFNVKINELSPISQTVCTFSIPYDSIININDIDVTDEIDVNGLLSTQTLRHINNNRAKNRFLNLDRGCNDYNKPTRSVCDDSNDIPRRNSYGYDIQDDLGVNCVFTEHQETKTEKEVKIKEEKPSINPKKLKDMNNNNMIKSIFPKIQIGEVKSDRFRMGMDGIAVKNNDGEFATFDMSDKSLTTELEGMTFDFGKFFYMPVKTVKVGDLVVVDNVIGYVTNTKEHQIEISDILSNQIVTKMPKKNRFGLYFHTKVVSMMDMFNEDEDSLDPMLMMAMMNGGENTQMLETVMLMNMMGAESEMNEFLPLMMMSNMNTSTNADGNQVAQNPMSQMLPLMMMGGEDMDMKKMLPLMMMGGQNGSDMNSILPLMMMGGKGEKGSMKKMLPLMMMSGQNGSNGSDMMAQMMMMKFLGGLEKENKELKESEVVISGTEAKDYNRFKEMIEKGEIVLKPNEETDK